MRVYEYLDGELTVWKRRAITRHLDECPPCAEGFTFEIELRRVIVSKCGEEVPADLKQPHRRWRSGSPSAAGPTARVIHRRRRFYDDATAASTMTCTPVEEEW